MSFHTQWPFFSDLSSNDPNFWKKIVTDDPWFEASIGASHVTFVCVYTPGYYTQLFCVTISVYCKILSPESLYTASYVFVITFLVFVPWFVCLFCFCFYLILDHMETQKACILAQQWFRIGSLCIGIMKLVFIRTISGFPLAVIVTSASYWHPLLLRYWCSILAIDQQPI